MPRIGVRPEEQSQGGLFAFEEGNGEIVNAVISNHTIPGFGTDCGYKLSIQRLNADWSPTADEPVEEFLKAGSAEKFHPGLASSSDDRSQELEIGAAKDAGAEEGAEGTCLLSVTGKGPDRKSKIATFVNSCIEHGVKPGLFDGYAPNLIGLKAHFTQFMMPRLPNSTAKKDPTCLIIGQGGQVAGGKIAQFPHAQTGATGGGQGKQTAAAAPVVAKPATRAPARPAAAKAAPAAAATAPAPAPAPVPAPSPVASDNGAGDDVESVAVQMLALVSDTAAGTTMTKQRLGSKLVTLLAKNRIGIKLHKPVQDLIKNDEWFAGKAEEFGWGYENGEVTIPAAEGAVQ